MTARTGGQVVLIVFLAAFIAIAVLVAAGSLEAWFLVLGLVELLLGVAAFIRGRKFG